MSRPASRPSRLSLSPPREPPARPAPSHASALAGPLRQTAIPPPSAGLHQEDGRVTVFALLLPCQSGCRITYTSATPSFFPHRGRLTADSRHEDHLGIRRIPNPSTGRSDHQTDPPSLVPLRSPAPPRRPVPPANNQPWCHLYGVPTGIMNLFHHLVSNLLTIIPPSPRSATVDGRFGEPPTSPSPPIWVPPLRCCSLSHSLTASPPAWLETAGLPPSCRHGCLPYFTCALPAHVAMAQLLGLGWKPARLNSGTFLN
jgi:hypothetical protein